MKKTNFYMLVIGLMTTASSAFALSVTIGQELKEYQCRFLDSKNVEIPDGPHTVLAFSERDAVSGLAKFIYSVDGKFKTVSSIQSQDIRTIECLPK